MTSEEIKEKEKVYFEFQEDSDFFKFRVDSLSYFPNHIHKYIEYHYILDGEQICFVNGHKYVLKKGDFLLAFPYCVHSFERSEAQQYIGLVNIDVLEKYNSILLQKLPESFKVEAELLPDNIEEIVRNVTYKNYINDNKKNRIFRHEYNDDNYIERHILYDACSSLIGEVLRCMNLYDVEKVKLRRYDDAVTRVMNFCYRYFDTDVSLADAAEACFLDGKYISKIFTKNIGISFTDFINEKRVAKACLMLERTDKNIIDIAFECGFRNQSTFNLVFKKHTGTTPKAYRQKK